MLDALAQKDDQSWNLNDLPEQSTGVKFRDTPGQAVRGGIIFPVLLPPRLHKLRRPGLIGQTTLESPANVPKLSWDGDLGSAQHRPVAQWANHTP